MSSRSRWKTFLRYVRLPKEVTNFERSYLRKLNRVTMLFYAAHLPVFTLVAWANDTGPLSAALMTLGVLAGPLFASKQLKNPRHVSLVHGFTSMMMGGLLVHFGQGPVQIEMHFYFFAALAMLSAFGNPLVIIVAAITVTLHHLALWLWLPSSVFNYDAPLWVVLVHAGFVVLESVATCYIARSFFDNVIGLEKIVAKRTRALALRNRDVEELMNSVGQGVATLDREGIVLPERSQAFDAMFHPPIGRVPFSQLLAKENPETAYFFELGLEQLIDGILPIEVSVEMLPKRVVQGGRILSLAYAARMGHGNGTPQSGGEIKSIALVVTDITAEEEQRRLEAEQRDLFTVFDVISKDREGLVEFITEAAVLVEALKRRTWPDLVHLKRMLHTLKGNSAIFGFEHLSRLAHELEECVVVEDMPPSDAALNDFVVAFEKVGTRFSDILGDERAVDVNDEEVEEAVRVILDGSSAPRELACRIASWRQERASKRLQRIGAQVQRVCARLGKEVTVEVQDNGLRLDSQRLVDFWSNFIHVARNAADHGIETPDEREALGKARKGHVVLRSSIEEGHLVVSLSDDGRGIDWVRVAEKAKAVGLPAEEHDDLVHALFSDGLTTRESVTNLSGRGVGLGAVQTACERIDGEIEVVSEVGKGTTFRFSVPWETSTGGFVDGVETHGERGASTGGLELTTH